MELIAYEMGYRVRPERRVYLTVASFFNQFGNTVSTELLTPFVETTPAPPRLILPVSFRNGLHGSSYGVEVTSDARLAPWWRVTANYSYLRVEMTRSEGSTDVSQERRYEGLSPNHQVQLQSSVDVPRGWSFDWLFRHVSELRAEPVPAYSTSDVRIGWQVTRQLEVAIVGQNLHEPRHVEWPGGGPSVTEIRRAAHVRLFWRP